MLHILFVCTGNTCRSPMAKAIYQRISEEYGIKSSFSSAGIGFCKGEEVSPNAVTVCNEIGIDISDHRSRNLRSHDVDITDIYVVMTEYHAEVLVDVGIPQNKIYILGGGIPDPYGSDLKEYRRCRIAIEKGIDQFCKILKKSIDNDRIRKVENEQNYNL